MIITAVRIFYGELTPDPTYKNVYDYFKYTDDPTATDNARPYLFLQALAAADSRYLNYHDVPFPESGTLYPVGENETGFSVELPTDGGFPEKPLYMILTVDAGLSSTYRYAFIESYNRTASAKIACVCRFDQWTENYVSLCWLDVNMHRTHQRRYSTVDATHSAKLYNGLSDPVPESMVQGYKSTVPVEAFGAKYVTDEGVDYLIVPIWLYWKMSTRTVYRRASGSSDPWVMAYLGGIDPWKGAVPVLASFLGVNRVNPATGEVKFLPCVNVFPKGTTTPRVAQSLTDILLTIGESNPYIVQSYITTIPPFSCTPGIRSTHYESILTVTDAEFIDNGRYIGLGDGNEYRIGSDQDGIGFTPKICTFITAPYSPNNLFYPGDRNVLALTDNVVLTSSIDPTYEPKIEESPYENKTLHLFGAEIDISPTPAIPAVSLVYTIGQHNDMILTCNGKEVYRASGVCSQFGMDTATDSLSNWLLSNYNTYQNAKLWKGIGAGTSFGLTLLTSIISGNFMPLIGAAIGSGTTLGQTVTGESATRADLQNSPNATNLPSDNGVDNMPLLDLPYITTRTLHAGTKSKIMDYWHVYGYPANWTGAIVDHIGTRHSYEFIQASIVNGVPGKYPAELADVYNAIRDGLFVWEPYYDSSKWQVDRRLPLWSITNEEA